jgi:hypothetical protein
MHATRCAYAGIMTDDAFCSNKICPLHTTGNHYHTQLVQLFNTTIKFHNVVHIALEGEFFHPGKGWCYGGESFLKHIRKLVQRNSFGTHVKDINAKVVSNYLNGLHIEFTKDSHLNLIRA